MRVEKRMDLCSPFIPRVFAARFLPTQERSAPHMLLCACCGCHQDGVCLHSVEEPMETFDPSSSAPDCKLAGMTEDVQSLSSL